MVTVGKYAAKLAESERPDMLVLEISGLSADNAAFLASDAQAIARANCPKMSGQAAGRIFGVSGDGWFGLHWLDDYVWYQEEGIRPFTMNSLEGKTIPMWVSDDDFSLRRANPKIDTKVTDDGRTLVKIFRRAAKKGERKIVQRRVGGRVTDVSVPKSYPGAPGRISRRENVNDPASGRVAGRIGYGNVGVRWRHPGLDRRGFLHNAILTVGRKYSIRYTNIVPAKAA